MTLTISVKNEKIVGLDLSDEKRVQYLSNKYGDAFLNAIRKAVRAEISRRTDVYIRQKLKEIDEDFSDLISEKSWLEGVFITRGISPEEVRNATVAVVVGKKAIEQAISDLSIPEDLIPDFQRAVEIARIIAWKEAIWKAEAKLEEQVDSMTLEELIQLNVEALCEDTYSEILLEV